MNFRLPVDWSRYTLKAEVVAKEIVSLRPFRFTSLEIPPVAGEDFALLLDSVRANGVYEPLTITEEGEVVDGQARLRAASQADIHQVPTRVLASNGGEADYALWAAVANVGRRHFTPAQRLTLVSAVLRMLEPLARERQEATRFGRSRITASHGAPLAARPNLDSPPAHADVRAQVGALVGVSRSQASKMVDLVKRGSRDLCEAVTSGKMSIHRAHEALNGRGSTHVRGDDTGRARRWVRRQIAEEPAKMLRILATLIPDSLRDFSRWTADDRMLIISALQNVIDSCELTLRRLGHPVARL